MGGKQRQETQLSDSQARGSQDGRAAGMGEFRTERHGAANVQASQMMRGPQAGPRGSGSVLYQPYAAGGPGLANALARLRAAAFASGRSIYDIAQDVVERRVRFDD